MAKPEIATERTRLSIPFDDRQRAIRAAGKLADGSNALDYVKEEKVWYAQPGANLSRLKEWIFDPNKVIEEPPLDIQAIEDEFTAWLEERGAIIKDPIEFDGQKHYVDTVDGKAGSRKGVYAAFLDGRPAGWYRDYKNGGEIQKWVSTGAAPNPEQMAMLRADAAARREQRAAAQADKFDQTANRLMEEYNRLPDATGDLAYLKNKQVIAANGLKADERGNVVIPLFNADGEFRTLERIWSDGSKHLEKDGQAWGSFFVVGGQLKDGDNLLYAEGYATAASISEAINQPVIMTVNAGNMVEVAGRLKDTFPNSTHYFLADNDIYKDENVGLEKATEAAELTAGHVLVPAFSNPKEGLTDYNDLHVSEGLEQVRLQVEGAINQMNRVDTMPTDNPNITDVNHSSTDSAAVADPEKAAPVASAPAAAEPEYTAPTDRDGDDEESNSASDLEAYAAMMAFGGETTDSAQQKPERIAPSESVANTAPAENETEEKKKTNEELENGIRWATNDNAETPPKERIDLEGLIARFGYRAEKDYTAYTLDGQDAFYDYGSHLRMATPEASQSDEMILAAVLTADKQHHRGIEITGSDEFKERVFNLISEYNIEVKLTNPEQRVKLLELKKANETAKETAKENVADSNANKQEGANEKTNSSVQQNGMRWEESASVQPKKQNASDTQKEDKAAGEPWEKGVIVAHGRAKYEWKEDESMNYFVTLKNEHGEKTLWGKDLERAVKDAGVDTERLVTVRKLGFVDVEVNAPVRDESNKIVRYETIQTKRNEWEVKPVYPQPTAGNEQAYKPSELVPYDAATFQKLRTTIQQITGVDLSREAVPEKELYWFLPNGKPAPESMTKPTGYKLPQESKTAGTPLLIAPHKKGERPDYFLVESRKGFMQGIAKDKESGEYHSVIGKVNKRIDKDGNWKTYMTLSAINKNAESGIVLHGYGHVDQGGKNLLYKNTIANEKQPQHLQAASDEVKNKTVMKQLFHPSNSAKRKDDERREQTHAPVAKSAPRP
ncbi:LPD7 domain-containing protein [Klebsiella pneumoniae]|uniref:LPD7 domain-containing protein n=1 Tax=Klebsiella pneumoniae TaxID=573 RepID=UPI00298E0DFA|nr:LPD7 domain-containing protein [Klebsiella pneumoniae]MDW7291311.1 LPD7 domain-containing protein [Klebsiella pneumoniae]